MKTFTLLSILIAFSFCSCKNNTSYSLNDYYKVEKIDAHYHIYTDTDNSVEQALKDNFKLLSINTFSGGCERVAEAHQFLRSLKKQHSETTAFTATFCLDGWDEPGWVDNTIAWIDQCIADGAIAVKVWKNIGMEFRDKESILIMIDDPQFDPVFQHLAKKVVNKIYFENTVAWYGNF